MTIGLWPMVIALCRVAHVTGQHYCVSQSRKHVAFGAHAFICDGCGCDKTISLLASRLCMTGDKCKAYPHLFIALCSTD